MKNYFNLKEFIDSKVARDNNIDNIPSFDIVINIKMLVDNLLNDLRDKWGSSIIVNSGYRCKKLNDLVGGVKNSAHLYGLAADIIPGNEKMNEFIEFIKKWAIDKDFDQIIIEKSGKTTWIHISLYNIEGKQRKQLFNLNKNC